jgi:hypothetical protein
MSTNTVQFVLLLFIAACVLVLALAWMRIRSAEVSEHERDMSNARILRELRQIQEHRPDHILNKENQ